MTLLLVLLPVVSRKKRDMTRENVNPKEAIRHAAGRLRGHY